VVYTGYVKDFLHHILFPRETNNHRAKLLHHSSLFFLTLFFFIGGLIISPLQKSHPDVLGVSTNISIDRLFQLTNEQRKANGLSVLTLNSQLSNGAAGKAQDMFTKNYWAHFAPDGGTPWGFIHGAGYQYIYAGENLARGFNTADEVVSAWMASPGHRANMLSSNYKEIGFAVQSGSLTGEDTTLVVQFFGSRTETTAPVRQQESIQIPTVTSAPALRVSSASPTAVPLIVVTPTSVASPTLTPSNPQQVAAVQNQPLVNTKPFAQNLVSLLIMLFILVLIGDIIIVKRRNIVRIVSHNLDHIIYLSIIFIALLIIAKGAIL
jgi:hypothetical protein